MNRFYLSVALAFAVFASCRAADWQPAKGPLTTPWTNRVKASDPLPEYPRPQMVRHDWQNLNGLWQFAVAKEDEEPPIGKDLDKQILVPFPVESALSGIMKHSDRVWYRRTFKVNKEWADQRLLLHFGAVNWDATVFLNGKKLGSHQGGYDGFTFDLTDALKKDGEQELIVGVHNPVDAGTQPRGKQVRKPGGIFYTPCTGIWQTVWLEPVPERSIETIRITPDADSGKVRMKLACRGSATGLKLGLRVAEADGKSGANVWTNSFPADADFEFKLDKPKLWSPESPVLYDFRLELFQDAKMLDSVSGYFAFRKIEVKKDDKGVTRMCLNGKPYFQVGPLDQGFWPDGIYTAPTDDALKYDIGISKKLGFNTIRKHVKVEPERWYYWCDKLGMVVWQDMPSGDKSIGEKDPDIKRTARSAEIYERELKAMIAGRGNHPCIVMWVPFNEGWGQFDTARIVESVKKQDPTRLVDCASGWADRAGVGDVHDFHVYPGPGSPDPEEKRAAVLGEFGGLGLGIDGHAWSKEKWSYQGTANKADLTRRYEALLKRVYELRDKPGLSAAIYTQTTDVETESNGLLTYDRKILKVIEERVAAVNRGDFTHMTTLKITEVVPTSKAEGQTWRYTLDKPANDWFKSDFKDDGWKEGKGGFGTKGTPGAVVRTEWKTDDIWLRREFTLPEGKYTDLQLNLHHDDDVEVFINGVLAVKLKGWKVDYEPTPIMVDAQAALKPGKNVFAVHCHQFKGGQYIDVGLIDVKEEKPAVPKSSEKSPENKVEKPVKLQAIPFQDVRIRDDFWSSRIETNHKVTVEANLLQCERTGRIRNFAIAAGLEKGKHEGALYNDSDVYKVIEGIAYTLAANRDDIHLRARADAIIDKIAAAQQPDGYLNTYYTLVEPEKRWKNIQYGHELYCSGHLIEAAVAYEQATHNKKLIDVACKLADHIATVFGPDKRHETSGHEEIELALIKLYGATGKKKYLDLALFFLNTRGTTDGRKLFGDYAQDSKPIREQTEVEGHAVRAMYLYCAMADAAKLTGDAGLLKSMDSIWHDVVDRKMYITGGIGPSASNEGFTVPYDLPNDTAYAETCAAIGMALWNHRLFLMSGDGKYADVLEREVYNGLISGVSLTGDRFFYVNPLGSTGGHHRVPWFDTSCCPTNLVRYIPAMGERAYADRDNGIWTVLYFSNTATTLLGAGKVKLIEKTVYPWDGDINFTVEPEPTLAFDFHLRIPGWCKGQPTLTVNGEEVHATPDKGYVTISRTWKAGDQVKLSLPMPVERVHADPHVKADVGKVALQRGPIVYCLEDADNDAKVRNLCLPNDAKLTASFDKTLLHGVAIIRGEGLLVTRDDDGKLSTRKQKFQAVPYSTWDNRGEGQMVVWLAETPERVDFSAEEGIKANGVWVRTSHCWSADTLADLNDGATPKNSGDHGIRRMTFWDHKGTAEWIAYRFPKDQQISGASVYWFDDTGVGSCRAPAQWRLLWKDGKEWKPVKLAEGKTYGTELDKFNAVSFEPVTTKELKLEVKLRPDFSGGVLKWAVATK